MPYGAGYFLSLQPIHFFGSVLSPRIVYFWKTTAYRLLGITAVLQPAWCPHFTGLHFTIIFHHIFTEVQEDVNCRRTHLAFVAISNRITHLIAYVSIAFIFAIKLVIDWWHRQHAECSRFSRHGLESQLVCRRNWRNYSVTFTPTADKLALV